MFGTIGNANPRLDASRCITPASLGSARRFICATNEPSGIDSPPPVSAGRAAKRSAWPAAGMRRTASAITADVLLVVEDRLGHGRRDDVPVQRCVDSAATSLASALKHGEGKRSAERGAAIARGYVTDHLRRNGTVAFQNQLSTFRQKLVPFDGKQANEILPSRPGRIPPPRRALADEGLLLRDDPAHPHVVRRDRHARLRAAEDVALLRAEHLHGFGAVGRDPKRL